MGVHKQGTIVAFVFRSRVQSTSSQGEASGEGVVAVAAGPKGSISRRRDDIVAMIRSIRTAS